jgi:phosphatidate phosphatase APP1
VDIIRRRGRRIFGRVYKDNATVARGKVTMSGSMPGFGGGDGSGYGEGRERGARRKKLAGYLKAANEIRQSYQQSYSQNWGGDNGDMDDDPGGIPGAFPDVAIVSHGDEQLIVFPSYAKRHTKEAPNQPTPQTQGDSDEDGPGNAEYWAREWQKFEDDRAVVDVDVRGWIYSPHRGPMNRKNRLLIGLARQLSGIPAPTKSASGQGSPDPAASLQSRHREHQARREQEKISREAEEILKKGEGEEIAAARGDYSENPKEESDSESIYGRRGRSGSPSDRPGQLRTRKSWNQPSAMSQAELMAANVNLMARLKPFLTNPLVSTPITVFFYDENTSVSRTVTTNEAGHFTMRAALDFIPTHVRVLASQELSATEEVKITQPKGVSVISDVDDTIKHSSIGSGAREIFRNAFIRDLGDLTIDGVKEWYNKMYDMGVGLHYVSNAPWQLFPVLVSFFQIAGLPPGSYHLKQYSGMLQGIFEPVAERKKGTLDKIMRDFPERRFILIGDSGEADLEVYTDVALANPGKVLAIFIRDVTSPETPGFFDSSLGPLSGDYRRGRDTRSLSRDSGRDSRTSQFPTSIGASPQRPPLPPRVISDASSKTSDGPIMGKLIDFDDEPDQASVPEPNRHALSRSATDLAAFDIPRRKSVPNNAGRVPPPRPSKPLALRGVTARPSDTTGKPSPPPPPKPRRPNQDGSPSHPLSQAQSSADLRDSNNGYLSSAQNAVSAAYNALPAVKSYMPGSLRAWESSDALPSSSERAPPPPPRRGTAASVTSTTPSRASTFNSNGDSDDELYRPNTNLPVNKKLDDASLEAIQMIEKTLTEMGVEGYGKDKQGNGKTGKGGGEMKTKDMKR